MLEMPWRSREGVWGGRWLGEVGGLGWDWSGMEAYSSR